MPTDAIPETLHQFVGDLRLPTLDPAVCRKLERLHADLVAANRAHNLTRLTERDDFYLKHVADSLSIAAVCPELAAGGLRVADVGCGAGFPGLPLALVFPGCHFVEIDSTAKKAAFVRDAIAALELPNCEALCARARELHRRQPAPAPFHLVLARAVAPGATLVRECRRLLRPTDGRMAAYKTPGSIREESDALRREARKANLQVAVSEVFALPGGAGERQFWLLSRQPSAVAWPAVAPA